VRQALTSARIPSAEDIPPLIEINTVKFVAGKAADFVGVLRTNGVVAGSSTPFRRGCCRSDLRTSLSAWSRRPSDVIDPSPVDYVAESEKVLLRRGTQSQAGCRSSPS
jgi:hypothetical protein